MTDGAIREFDRLPAVAPFYLKALANRRNRLDRQGTIPHIEARVTGLGVDKQRLIRYRKVCGFAPADSLPVTYPHVLAFPLQMAVMTHARFPLPLMGLVHVRNRIVWQRPIAIDEKLALSVSVSGHRDVGKGVEFDLITCVAGPGGGLAWEETSTMLARRKRPTDGKSGGNTQTPPALEFTPVEDAAWRIPPNIGRRYAWVAGDYNPIHLSGLSARLFGFPQAIATGMWLNARIAAALHAQLEDNSCALDIAFKKPVLLPATVMFRRGSPNGGVEFALTSTGGERVHVTGEVRHAEIG
jgi:acyl dehydratase